MPRGMMFARGGGRDTPLRFPSQKGRPVQITRDQWEDCCCYRSPCTVCAAATLREWTQSYAFPTATSGQLPYVARGDTLDDITMHGDITTDGDSLGRTGAGNTGGGLIADTALLIFPIIRRDFVISYEYRYSGEGKHWLEVRAATTINTATFLVGSWGGAPTTQGIIAIGRHQINAMCHQELPPAELAGQLPQIQNEWRVRTIRKAGATVTMADGSAGPFLLPRCWVPVRGYIGMCLGPGVRVRNIRIDPA